MTTHSSFPLRQTPFLAPGQMRTSAAARSWTRRAVLLATFVVAASGSLPTLAGPRSGTTSRTGLTSYDELLARYVVESQDGINRVDYAAWKSSAADRQTLDAFIAEQSALSPSAMKRDEAFAYWANLYNAITLKVVLDAYPVRSIRDIRSTGVGFDLKAWTGPWRTKRVSVSGRTLSLDDIEHEIMRPTFSDPRVHYAVHCASIGCPNLRPSAWRTANLESALDDAARAYVNHPRGVAVRPDATLKVSSLYHWYAEDFGPNELAIVRHFRRHAKPGLAERLRTATRISAHDYDWSLNDAGEGAESR